MRFRIGHRKIALLGLAVFGAAPLSVSALSFTITDLGTLGGSETYATAINDNGWVTGRSETAIGLQVGEDFYAESHAFLYNGSTMVDLGTLGFYQEFDNYSSGSDINNYGHITGTSVTADGSNHAFIFDGNTMQDIGVFSDGPDNSFGNAINDSGQVTGGSKISTGNTNAFLYDGTTMNNLETNFSTYSRGTGINNSGQVTGENRFFQAFFHDGSTMNELGTLGGQYSSGDDINDSGQIVGQSETADGDTHAFLYDGGTMSDLGTLGGEYSSANGINEIGQVVGLADTAGGDTHAFLYDVALGGMLDLNSLIDPLAGWVLESAMDINIHGQITGNGVINGVDRAFVLTRNNTEIGQNTTVNLLPDPDNEDFVLNLLFEDITGVGITTVSVTNEAPPVGAGLFEVLGGPDGPTFYDISTTALFEGTATIGISYAEEFENAGLGLWHYNTTSMAWEDLTTNIDTVNNIIYGVTDSFSPFAIGIQAPVPEPATMTLLGLGLVGLVARSRRDKKQA